MKQVKQKKLKRRDVKTNAAGRRLLAALAELEYAADTGDFSKLSIREVEIVEPSKFSARDIKALRVRLGVSQELFASLLGVSRDLVKHWEYGIRKPAPVVCRLLEQVRADPKAFWSGVVKRKSVA
ncbi:MAG TPA: helix-turn-helix domain-containing protein [Tepidisphaeraceae bacterium]|jgi:putative transcriptional regulator|nr:helix-turn-helix domain-containing protein [Tepidisphaeraceae bacterium]